MTVDKTRPLSVGAIAQRSGVAVSTIHFYEAKGLIKGERTAGNQRRYPRSVLRRIAIIRTAQYVGLSLSELKDFLDRIPEGPVTSTDCRRLSAEWSTLLNERIASLMRLRDRLETCIGCGCMSLTDCPLRNPEDRLGAVGSGPQLLLVNFAREPRDDEDSPVHFRTKRRSLAAVKSTLDVNQDTKGNDDS